MSSPNQAQLSQRINPEFSSRASSRPGFIPADPILGGVQHLGQPLVRNPYPAALSAHSWLRRQASHGLPLDKLADGGNAFQLRGPGVDLAGFPFVDRQG